MATHSQLIGLGSSHSLTHTTECEVPAYDSCLEFLL